jgi:hypothetical protein
MSIDAFHFNGNVELNKPRLESRNYHYRYNNNLRDQEYIKSGEGKIFTN